MQNVLFCDKKLLKDLIRSHHSRIATMQDEMVKFKFTQLLHKTKPVKTAEKLSACKAQDSPIPGHLLSLPTIIQRHSKHNCLLMKVRRNTLLKKYMQPNLLGRFNLHPDEILFIVSHTTISVFPSDKAVTNATGRPVYWLASVPAKVIQIGSEQNYRTQAKTKSKKNIPNTL